MSVTANTERVGPAIPSQNSTTYRALESVKAAMPSASLVETIVPPLAFVTTFCLDLLNQMDNPIDKQGWFPSTRTFSDFSLYRMLPNHISPLNSFLEAAGMTCFVRGCLSVLPKIKQVPPKILEEKNSIFKATLITFHSITVFTETLLQTALRIAFLDMSGINRIENICSEKSMHSLNPSMHSLIPCELPDYLLPHYYRAIISASTAAALAHATYVTYKCFLDTKEPTSTEK